MDVFTRREDVRYWHEEAAANISHRCIPWTLANVVSDRKECTGFTHHEAGGTRLLLLIHKDEWQQQRKTVGAQVVNDTNTQPEHFRAMKGNCNPMIPWSIWLHQPIMKTLVWEGHVCRINEKSIQVKWFCSTRCLPLMCRREEKLHLLVILKDFL